MVSTEELQFGLFHHLPKLGGGKQGEVCQSHNGAFSDQRAKENKWNGKEGQHGAKLLEKVDISENLKWTQDRSGGRTRGPTLDQTHADMFGAAEAKTCVLAFDSQCAAHLDNLILPATSYMKSCQKVYTSIDVCGFYTRKSTSSSNIKHLG